MSSAGFPSYQAKEMRFYFVDVCPADNVNQKGAIRNRPRQSGIPGTLPLLDWRVIPTSSGTSADTPYYGNKKRGLWGNLRQ